MNKVLFRTGCVLLLAALVPQEAVALDDSNSSDTAEKAARLSASLPNWGLTAAIMLVGICCCCLIVGVVVAVMTVQAPKKTTRGKRPPPEIAPVDAELLASLPQLPTPLPTNTTLLPSYSMATASTASALSMTVNPAQPIRTREAPPTPTATATQQFTSYVAPPGSWVAPPTGSSLNSMPQVPQMPASKYAYSATSGYGYSVAPAYATTGYANTTGYAAYGYPQPAQPAQPAQIL